MANGADVQESYIGEEMGAALATLEYGVVPDILTKRYASDAMTRVWSPEGSVLIERFVQLQVMQLQSELGAGIPASHVDDYRAVIGDINLADMDRQEAKTKHDTNARITVFNELTGHQDVATALTSRDITDNADQVQKKLGLEIIKAKVAAAIGGFARAASTNHELAITGRTHNVAAQLTTFGKELASCGEELIDGYKVLEFHIDNMKLRGIKGAVGTQQDILNLFDGDEEKVDVLDMRLAQALGFRAIYNSVGQIYPRSQDLASIQALSHVVGPMSNFATIIRHAMGRNLLIESDRKRVGSNAMPHKINPRTSERVVGFYRILGGFEAMMRPMAGEQWGEGDVSCSVVRRVALPGSFNAADGAFEAGLTVLDGFRLFESVVAEEVDRNLPFLATTKVLTDMIKSGIGREDAHDLIREHVYDLIKHMQDTGSTENDLLERLGADEKVPLTLAEIKEAVAKPLQLTGRASTQAQRFVAQAEKLVAANAGSASYQPAEIL
jgi:adenylosuccinate lyase